MSYYQNDEAQSTISKKGTEYIGKTISNIFSTWPKFYAYTFITLFLLAIINLGFQLHYFKNLANSELDRSFYFEFTYQILSQMIYVASIVILLTKKSKWALIYFSIFTFLNLLFTVFYLYSSDSFLKYLPSIVVNVLDATNASSLRAVLYRIATIFIDDRQNSSVLNFLSIFVDRKLNASGFILELFQLYSVLVVLASAWSYHKELTVERIGKRAIVASTAIVIGYLLLGIYVINQTTIALDKVVAPTGSEAPYVHDGTNRIQ